MKRGLGTKKGGYKTGCTRKENEMKGRKWERGKESENASDGEEEKAGGHTWGGRWACGFGGLRRCARGERLPSLKRRKGHGEKMSGMVKRTKKKERKRETYRVCVLVGWRSPSWHATRRRVDDKK